MIMKTVVKIELIRARNHTIRSRPRDKFGPRLRRWAHHGSEHFASCYERQADYIPRHRHKRGCNWGPCYPVNRERRRRRIFSANQRYVESNLLTSVARGGSDDPLYAGDDVWRARDSCTAYRLLLNAVSRAASPIYMVSLCFYRRIRAFHVSFPICTALGPGSQFKYFFLPLPANLFFA